MNKEIVEKMRELIEEMESNIEKQELLMTRYVQDGMLKEAALQQSYIRGLRGGVNQVYFFINNL
ncbi:hypothetical protein KY334_04770 [Candidatus Woesearchaeota archaeon]|nr:hypothetical protein [Candidatus Woesearchaeota archaeon]